MNSLKFIISLLVFIVVAHFFALQNYWYWTYQWLDIPMHFLGGFWAAAAVAAILNFKFLILKELKNSNFLLFTFIILAFVSLIGVFLEFAEFLYDVFISSRGYSGFLQLGAADTIGDLFFDLLGGTAFLVIYRFLIKKDL